jgi:hypothetical protein
MTEDEEAKILLCGGCETCEYYNRYIEGEDAFTGEDIIIIRCTEKDRVEKDIYSIYRDDKLDGFAKSLLTTNVEDSGTELVKEKFCKKWKLNATIG